MKVWPFGVARRWEAPNRLMLRWLKTVVVSDEEKAPERCQVGTGKTNASESLLTCRNRRPEFLAAQTEPVITTLDLFDAWREEDANSVRRLLFSPASGQVAQAPPGGGPLAPFVVQGGSGDGRRRWFRRG